ncbi:MAG: TRAP transporter fused permease subunit [Bacillota bacterium]|nr:TRAP transporter fused permease subunit [Bacillota bacterium]
MRFSRFFSLERLITVIAVAMSVFLLYVVIYMPITQDQIKIYAVMFSLVLFFLVDLQSKKHSVISKVCIIILIILSLASTTYMQVNYQQIARLMGIMTLPATIVGTIILLMVWEASRRFWGLLIPIFVLIMLLYGHFGYLLPDPFYHGGISFVRIIGYSTMFFRGIFGRLAGIGATLIIPLFIFANMLDVMGGRKMFLRVGHILAGRFRSGPAQAAVVCSLLFGSISGSTAANVATTGSFTIPMMKSAGYKAEYAAAVEGVASTGGQFMPPVMGSVAFVMVGFLGIPYSTIAIAALVPALLFYFSISLAVELRARKDQVVPLDAADSDDTFLKILKDYFHLLIGVGVLIYLLFIRYPVSMSVVYGILSIAGFSLIRIMTEENKLEKVKNFVNNIIEGLAGAAKTGAPLFLFVVLVGVAIEMLVTTGLAQKFSNMLIDLSGGSFLLLLIFTAIACIIFGMGMPSVSAYILVAVLGAPALVEAGASIISAHMFVFIISCLSAITPPVAINPMVACGIAKCKFWPAALTTVRLGLPAFILPFYFMYRPALLVVDTSFASTMNAVFFAVLALLALGIASEGYLFRGLNIIEKIVLIAAAGLLLFPGLFSSILGAVIVGVVLLYFYLSKKKLSRTTEFSPEI